MGGNKGEFIVTVYRDINDKSVYEEWRMKNCSSVPDNWNAGQFWVDVHGRCLQFFEGRVCSGRSLQLQPSSSSTIFRWNFPDYYIKSVSPCQSMPPSSSGPSGDQHVDGNHQVGGSNSKPIGGSNQGGPSGPSGGGGLVPASPGSGSSKPQDG